ncbi:phosphoenolpyruvate synthase [Streptosporangiaceae bacterium NEAU-GS5]|nr:phosphoenolpyruvate synthase [Streptosporangiaceae bacterium NEAU-GS5]
MLPLVGGKGANLGVLTRAGLAVPPGFCVTTTAYGQMAAQIAIGEPQADPARMRAAIFNAAIPDAVAKAIRAALADVLPDEPVAVRSSATAEDLPQASFAGQQDTFLNVQGPDAVLDAVRRCWASLWTDRAVAYRDANGVPHDSVQLAVVVQRMIQAVVAGVMFTANPVTGRRHEAVIDASPGLGEAVVSGLVNPDHFVVSGGRIVDRRVGDKRVVIRSLPGGGVERAEGPGPEAACLTDDQVLALAALGERVERHYGSPQDTEWAFDADNQFWLTQARPITTLYPIPEGRPGDRAYFCFSLAQGLLRPITPMGISAFRVLASGAAAMAGSPVSNPLAGPAVFTDPGQRIFIDLTAVLRNRFGRAVMSEVFDVMEARSAVVMRGLFDDPRFAVRPTPIVWLSGVAKVIGLAFRYGVPSQVIRAIVNPDAARRRIAGISADLRGRLAAPAHATSGQRLDHVERVLLTQAVPLLPRIAPGAAAGFLMLGLAGALRKSPLRKNRAEPGELQTVLRGLPHNVTTEMDLMLWRLATDLRAQGITSDQVAARPPAVEAALGEFLGAYGDRAVAEIDLGLPRWSEDPAHVLGVLANYLRLDDPGRAPDLIFERGAREAEAMIEKLARRAGLIRGGLLRFALSRARKLAGLREQPKFELVRVLAAMRRELRTVGEALEAAGSISAADDVFFLTLTEARTGRDLRREVTERRAAYEREMRRRQIPRVLLSDGTEPEATATRPAEGGLSGTPASAGVVTGRARVILDPVGAHLEPGEILIAPSTDPGWTPLFLTAGGLVMEMGGANSHGAVVAREYGIPAVVGVHGATTRIATGTEITVDGTSGHVTV